MQKEILQYIFDQIVDTSSFYAGYGSPWIYTDGRIYATDGKSLLCLENTEGRSEAFSDNGEKHPNVVGLIAPFSEADIVSGHYVMLSELESFSGSASLAGVAIKDTMGRNIAKILRLFGLEGTFFHTVEGTCLRFGITDTEGNVTGELYCLGMASPQNVQQLRYAESTDGSKSIHANEEKAEKYYLQCLEQDKLDEEAYARENFRVFEVTLAKYKTICVKADTEEQAKRIALDCEYLLDFDDCCEVDECEESRRDDVRRSYSSYYSEKGRQYWED